MRIKLTAVLLCFMFIVNLPAASLAGRFSGQLEQWDQVLPDTVTVQNQLTALRALQDDETLYIFI